MSRSRVHWTEPVLMGLNLSCNPDTKCTIVLVWMYEITKLDCSFETLIRTWAASTHALKLRCSTRQLWSLWWVKLDCARSSRLSSESNLVSITDQSRKTVTRRTHCLLRPVVWMMSIWWLGRFPLNVIALNIYRTAVDQVKRHSKPKNFQILNFQLTHRRNSVYF